MSAKIDSGIIYTRTSGPSALQRSLLLRGHKNLKYKFLKIWPILRGERKSMKIWQIMTRRLEKSMKIWSILRGRFKKYENVANIDKEIEKVCKIWLMRF